VAILLPALRATSQLPVAIARTFRGTSPATSAVMILTILLVILVLMALGSAPAWPYARSWGYYPSGGLGLLVLLLLVVFLLSPNHAWW
jgi:Protein of unknown function (DUF3309)